MFFFQKKKKERFHFHGCPSIDPIADFLIDPALVSSPILRIIRSASLWYVRIDRGGGPMAHMEAQSSPRRYVFLLLPAARTSADHVCPNPIPVRGLLGVLLYCNASLDSNHAIPWADGSPFLCGVAHRLFFIAKLAVAISGERKDGSSEVAIVWPVF